VTENSLQLPDEFDQFASEVEAKGWFGEASLNLRGKKYRLNFYDARRLRQEISDSIGRGKAFFEPNLVVIKSLTRAQMESAAGQLVEAGVANDFHAASRSRSCAGTIAFLRVNFATLSARMYLRSSRGSVLRRSTSSRQSME